MEIDYRSGLEIDYRSYYYYYYYYYYCYWSTKCCDLMKNSSS